MVRRRNYESWIISLVVLGTFILFHMYYPSLDGSSPSLTATRRPTGSVRQSSKTLNVQNPLLVNRFHNKDASLSPPYLDKVNKYWHVKGSTVIKNWDEIRLTSGGEKNRWGVLLSNGMGDNVIDNFEVVVDFSLDATGTEKARGAGMVILVTSHHEYMTKRLHSGYARQQFQLSTALEIENHDLMGFPRNMPGLAIVIDTFKDDPGSRAQPPNLKLFLNDNVREQYYDLASDGERSTSKNLITAPMPTEEIRHRIRIIYLECIGYLKVDIDYGAKDRWKEIFRQEKNLKLPKNARNGQRYIGVGALNGEHSQNVKLHNVDTSEYQWVKGENDRQLENSFSYAKEITRFLNWELGEHIKMEEDDYAKWAEIKSALADESFIGVEYIEPSIGAKIGAFLKTSLIWCILAVGVYLMTKYLKAVLRKKGIIKRKSSDRDLNMGLLG
ncbi:HBR207Wp [Eremothecium sinecaudum]|uniref:HBR207Wp n=1 Tax=Eremothecium sinecaudum TaxID=45286 RepID=A0A109UX12_9SACH|nr:HBR207Wp [Eremothecium sinecaudum]AMD19108.1 HBR207Wp [Eremothecium sinecaudum]